MIDSGELRACAPCAFGLHGECLAPKEDGDCCCGNVDWSAPFAAPAAARGDASVKSPSEMRDGRSTGRKRADMIAPIFDMMVCEWSGLKFAGGGVVPIIGCDGNLLRADTKDGDGGDLHHGPNKNTLDNTPGVNLHRICKSCHHTWHAKNDRFYDTPRPPADQQWLPNMAWLPHDPFTKATDEELAEVAATRDATNRKQRDLPPVGGLL